MPTLQEILQDQNYLNANPATKKAIFDRWSASDTNYTGANPATQQAIRSRFGVGGMDMAAPEEPQEKSGFLRQVADVPLSVGRGAVTGVRMIADAFGAGSGASEALKGAEGYLAGLMSAQSKNDEKEVSRILKDAEDKGMLDQVKAGFKAFSVAPIDLLSQGFGTAAPAVLGILGGKVLGAGALGMSAIGTGVGAGMGAGSAKGGIYEEVKAALKEANVDEAKAEQVAIEAQKYGGKNMDQILLSAGLGGLAGRFGLESSARRMLTGAVGKEAGKGAAREVAEGATRTAITESVPELLQGSQEQVAKNIALQREGFDVPTMRGVGSSGTLEALAGAGLGAVAGGTEAGLRRQARGEADRILAEEEKVRAEEDAAKEKIAAEKLAAEQELSKPYTPAPSLTGTDIAARMGQRPGEGGMSEMLAGRRIEQEDARVEEARRARVTPESEEAGRNVLRTDRDAGFRSVLDENRAANEIAAKKEAERLARVESQQAKKQAALLGEIESPMMAAIRERKEADAKIAEAESLKAAAEQKRQQEASLVPAKSITGSNLTANLTGTPAGGDLAGMLSSRREAESAKAEVPLDDNYAFLQREKQRLLQEPSTPQVKQLIQRIDTRMGEVLTQDIERQRADAEAAKTSVFGQKELPPVESRDVVVGGEELATAQAKERFPETVIDRKEKQSLARMEKLREQPAPPESEAEEQMRQLEKVRSRIKSTNLYGELIGKLAPGDVTDISPDIGRNLRVKGNRGGAFLSDIVSGGTLNDYLPPDMRPDAITFDEQESTEYIKDKLRNKDHLTFDATMESRKLDDEIGKLEAEVRAPRAAEFALSDVEPGEAASVERAAGDQAVVESTDQIRYKRSTGKVGIGKQAVQDTVDTVKARWANAPEVVVAESMDDPAIPQEVRDHNKEAVAKGAKGSPQGFYYKGKAYVIADSIGSTNEAVEALMHEALGHFGLRGVFGPKMEAVLRDVIKQRRTEVEGKAEQYGLDPKSDKDMLEAAEEVLAVMAQTKPGLPFVKRALAVIRNFLRDLGFNIKMSDADIIQKYILPARAFVESGKGRPTEGKPAAMRSETSKTGPGTAAFNRWFGDSKVVDEDGKPMVVYHASTSPITEFKPKGYGTAGDHSYFYFAASEAWSKKFAKDELGVKPSMHKTYLSISNPLDLRGKVMTGKDWTEYLSSLGVNVTGALRQKLDSAPVRQEIAAWQLLRYDTPQNGNVREQLIDAGYDGLIMNDVVRGKMDNTTYVAFEPTQIKSATGNIGTYDPDNADIRYQREEGQPNPTRQNIFGEPVLGSWSITVDPKMELQDGLIYKMLDKNIDVKRIIEAVKDTGKEIATKWNPYLQEELYHGRTANASQEFRDNEWLPLLMDMEKKGVTVGELEKYLLNRHAEAYNKHVAKVNPTRPEMQDGGSSVTTEDARKYLAGLDAETKAKYDELAARVDGITKGTRQLLVDTGYEKAKTIKAWEEAFPTYVPLMREEGDFDYNFGSFGTGRGFDVRRDFSRSAMGSKRNVVDIIGNVIAARNNAIALTEKNRVAQAVYGLALEAPNPDFWMAINPDAEKIPQDAIDELRAMGLDPEAIEFLMKEPKQRTLDPKKNEVVSRINTKLRENDYVLATRINGEKRYVFFNPKDPRSNRAATALKNLDAQDLGTALGMVAKVTRWMASVNTQYNPIFGPYNFLRDLQSAALQLSTTELAGQQKEIAASVVPSLRVIYSSLRKRRKGEKVEGDADFLKMADLWKEFQKEGGQTGFKDNFSRTQDRTEALLDEMAKITEGKAKAGARAVFDWLSDYNDSLENAVRLSAYKVAKEKFIKEGSSPEEAKQRAASLAKNLTVNFNRKGDVATQMGALYAFFNASMQGTARMIETLKGPIGKKIIAGGLLLGGMQAALLAAAGFDEDEPPEFIRSKNIVIPTGDGDYFAFPMPLGFHVIPGVSRILTEWTLSGFKDTAKRVTDLTGLFLDAFNPIGNAGWSAQTLAPTFADPIVALFENKDWTGKPISKEDLFSLRPTPGYTRAREGANVLSTNLAEFLNYASGGTKHQPGVLSPTPEQIEYLVGQVFGGVGREAIKLSTSVEKTITGEDLPPYKIPLYGRFVGETKSSAAESNKFYKNMERLNRLDLEIKGRREDREPIGDFMRENPESRLLPMANKTYKDVQALRKRRKELLERDAPRESIQAVEKQITRKMQVLNDRVNAFEERSN
jgi:hypothetical protein